MANRQAQNLYASVFKIERTIPLGRRLYTVDICCSENDEVCISAVNSDGRCKVDRVKMFSPSGLYIAIKTNNWFTDFIYGTEDSVFSQSTDDNRCYKIWPEACVQEEDPTAFGSLPKQGFSPQGLAFRKLGGFLICLWNNKVGQRSYGKVIVLDGNPNFQIVRDKNTPLYVCPTYIAENGNGDICVSDVRAVVVTDAGGMLRFRYHGLSSDIFDPYGICCDSSCNIIVADMKNNKISLIDKDGAFLYHVTYEGMNMPRALCIDEDDNMYVGEWDSDAVKVIKRKPSKLF